jgi:hypothetical protein
VPTTPKRFRRETNRHLLQKYATQSLCFVSRIFPTCDCREKLRQVLSQTFHHVLPFSTVSGEIEWFLRHSRSKDKSRFIDEQTQHNKSAKIAEEDF